MTRRALIVLLLLGACTKSTTVVPATTTPAPVNAPPTPAIASNARGALDNFMAAVRAQDLQALSLAWGDKNGPVRDSRVIARDDLEARELVLLKCLKHDRYRVLSESPAADNERVMSVEITTGTQTRVADFFSARGADRWYLRYVQPPCPAK